MRLIDADALKEKANDADYMPTWKWLSISDLYAAPTIDAVPVVRCKDCTHWGMHKSLNVPWCFEMHIDKSEDGFCDIGERSEE